MRKFIIISLIIINMFILQACKVTKNQQSNDSQVTTESIQQTKITEQQVLKIIKAKLGSKSDDLSFDVKLASNNNFWWIISYHEYDNSETGGIQATYYVDVNSGKLFEAFINNFDNLIPLDNITFVDEPISDYANSKDYSTKFLMNSLSEKNKNAYGYYGLIKRENNFYYVVAYGANPANDDSGAWDFYLINKNSNEIFKWDLQNDKLIKII